MKTDVRHDATGTAKTPTAIVQEIAGARNPYLAEDVRVHGYSLRELAGRMTATDMLFLQLRGQLPTRAQRRLLDDLLVMLSVPGPRHPAVRAAMYAAAGMTVRPHLLPLGLCVLSGDHLGAKACGEAMTYLQRSALLDPREACDAAWTRWHTAERRTATSRSSDEPSYDDAPGIAPGFGSRFGGRDPLPARFLARLARRADAGPYLRWARAFNARLARKNAGVLAPGLAAAAFLDLGLNETQGCGVFQLAAAPNIIALSAEMSTRGRGAMPFLPDARYEIVEDGGDHG